MYVHIYHYIRLVLIWSPIWRSKWQKLILQGQHYYTLNKVSAWLRSWAKPWWRGSILNSNFDWFEEAMSQVSQDGTMQYLSCERKNRRWIFQTPWRDSEQICSCKVWGWMEIIETLRFVFIRPILLLLHFHFRLHLERNEDPCNSKTISWLSKAYSLKKIRLGSLLGFF